MSDKTHKVHDSYMAFRDQISAGSRISIQAVLGAREAQFQPCPLAVKEGQASAACFGASNFSGILLLAAIILYVREAGTRVHFLNLTVTLRIRCSMNGECLAPNEV
jgi:hypothetical protein